MLKNKETKKADEIVKALAAELKKDPSSGMSIFIDLLSVERFSAQALLKKILTYSLSLNLVCICIIGYLANPDSVHHIVQKKLNGELAELATSNKPYYELSEIKSFAASRAIAVHNWDYSNYKDKFSDERGLWDSEPLNTFIDSLIERGVFDSAKQYRRRFTAVVASQITVLQQLKYSGNYKIYRVTFKIKDESIDIEGVDSKIWEVSIDIREALPSEGSAGLMVKRYDEAINQL
jgi:hypothetical protein